MRALRTVQYIDKAKTETLRQEAAARIPPQYVPVPFAQVEAEDALRNTFKQIRETKAKNQGKRAAVDVLRQNLPIKVSPATLLTLLHYKGDLSELEEKAIQILRRAMQGNIRSDSEEDIKNARENIQKWVRYLALPSEETSALIDLASNAIRPNLVIDQASTQKLRESAKRSVKPVYEKILFGEIVLHRGEKITPEVWDKLEALGIVRRFPPLDQVLSLLVLVAISFILIRLLLMRYKREIFQQRKLEILLWLLIFLGFLGFKTGITFQFTPMIVSAALGIALASLLGGETALITLPFVALLMSISTGPEVNIGAMSLLSGAVAIASVLRIRERLDLIKASLAVALTVVLVNLLLGGVAQGMDKGWMALSIGWGLLSGVIGVIIAWLGVAILERIFGITTSFQLLELANPQKPLLRELLINAPGSYQHSIITANLAEAGAEAIGADALLCRVGALYHDIGKMKRPLYFIENQTAENLHDNLPPTLSSLVITAHVKDGVEMAKEAKLPPRIIDIIAQHHGTTLVSYFYHRALGEELEVEEAKFRYEGPKPQTKEAAIVMLADAVEAAVRSLPDKSLPNVQALVSRIFEEKIADGQLSECDLSFRDLPKLQEAFLSILKGMLHKRVEYPPLKEEVSSDKDNPSKKDQIEKGVAQKSGRTRLIRRRRR